MKLPSQGSCHLIYVASSLNDQQPEMTAVKAAQKLEEAIESGDFVAVKRLLDDVVDFADVKAIEKEFPDRDPVVVAIDNNQEHIAVYLVEKKFSTDKCYCYPGEECEPHCYATHQGKKCPSQYDALDKAKTMKMNFLEKVITDVQCGKRKAGDSLSEESRISVDSTDSLERQQFMDEINEHNQDKHLRIAERMEKFISDGDFIGMKNLLKPVVQINEVEAILQEYSGRDPLIFALEAKQEKIACYLIEKRFPYNIPYFYGGEECDEWCSRLHPDRLCPNQYTAIDVAKANQLRSVQGLIEGIMAGKRHVGASLKLHRRVSLDTMPVFERDVIMETEEYRLATELCKLIDAGDLDGVKSLVDSITDSSRVQKIEYLFDDRDPVTYAVDKGQLEIADYLVHQAFSFTKPYRIAGRDCDRWCYSTHGGKSCPASYTALSLAESRGHDQLHQHMLEIKQGKRSTRLHQM